MRRLCTVNLDRRKVIAELLVIETEGCRREGREVKRTGMDKNEAHGQQQVESLVAWLASGGSYKQQASV